MARSAKTLEQVAEQAMALPSESRAQLADLLVESLDGEELGRIEQLWLVEANDVEMRSVQARLIPSQVKKPCERYETRSADEI